jgi:anti-anti-sigma factor
VQQQHLSIGDWFVLDIAAGKAKIRGECDLAVVRQIQPWLAILDGASLVVDLGEVTFFDTAALRALVAMRERNPKLRMINASRAVRQICELTNALWLIDNVN